MQWQVELSELEDGSSPVLDWYSQQNAKVQAKFARIFDLLEAHGTAVKYPYVDSITDTKLFEIRVEQQTNIYRILYFACTGRDLFYCMDFRRKLKKHQSGTLIWLNQAGKSLSAEPRKNDTKYYT